MLKITFGNLNFVWKAIKHTLQTIQCSLNPGQLHSVKLLQNTICSIITFKVYIVWWKKGKPLWSLIKRKTSSQRAR